MHAYPGRVCIVHAGTTHAQCGRVRAPRRRRARLLGPRLDPRTRPRLFKRDPSILKETVIFHKGTVDFKGNACIVNAWML